MPGAFFQTFASRYGQARQEAADLPSTQVKRFFRRPPFSERRALLKHGHSGRRRAARLDQRLSPIPRKRGGVIAVGRRFPREPGFTFAEPAAAFSEMGRRCQTLLENGLFSPRFSFFPHEPFFLPFVSGARI